MKEVTVSACRNYLAEHMQSSNTGACTATGQTRSVGRSGAEYGLLLTMAPRSHLSQMIRKKETSSSRSRRPFTPAASSGEVTHTFMLQHVDSMVTGVAGFRVVRDIACWEEEEEVEKKNPKKPKPFLSSTQLHPSGRLFGCQHFAPIGCECCGKTVGRAPGAHRPNAQP